MASAGRAQVAGGVPRIRAARLATAEFAPIILAAGIIVAAAAASLRAAISGHHIDYVPGCADLGDFDVLVGVNLLREGLDLPEAERRLTTAAERQSR